MDGWMDGWMGGWVDGWMDVRMGLSCYAFSREALLRLWAEPQVLNPKPRTLHPKP